MANEYSIYPSASINQAYWDTSASFDPQLPKGPGAGTNPVANYEGELPPAILFEPDGTMHLSFFAPEAREVSCEIYRTVYPFEKNSKGLWRADINPHRFGFCPIVFRVDGADILNPLAPVGYGCSAPINYADIPCEGNAFCALKDVPHGTVCQEYYYSRVTKLWRTCLIYLPAAYWKEPERRFPVMYLQHGHGENEQCWLHQGRANFILDNLIASGEAKDMIIVMNNGMVQQEINGVHVLNPQLLEEVLIQDCIPFIDGKYRTIDDKWNRAMAGLSMGSMQTSVTTMKHPDLFAYAGVFSGFVSPNRLNWTDEHLKALDDRAKFKADFRVFFRGCGDEDFMYSCFQSDSRLFEEKGLSPEECPAHHIVVYPGEHEWNVWRKCLRDFARLIFK